MKNTTQIAPPNLHSCPQPKSRCRRSLLAAGLTLGLAFLVQSARSVPSYGAAVLADNPVAFWQLNETTGSTQAADSSPNALNGTYGADGVAGATAPQSPYVGFTNGQSALLCTVGDLASAVTIPPLNLNTNAVTIAMWINPSGQSVTFTGLLMNRTSGGDAEGFGFGGSY